MDKILNQFRRVYADNGSGDVDFTQDEKRLREAQERLAQATQELVRSSERLNAAAMNAYPPEEQQLGEEPAPTQLH